MDSPGLDSPGLDSPGLDSPGFDSPGFDSPRLDSPGFDSPGFDSPGFDSPGFDSPGFDSPGFDSPGFDSAGLDSLSFLPEALESSAAFWRSRSVAVSVADSCGIGSPDSPAFGSLGLSSPVSGDCSVPDSGGVFSGSAEFSFSPVFIDSDDSSSVGWFSPGAGWSSDPLSASF